MSEGSDTLIVDDARDVRPSVRLPRAGLSGAAIAILIAIGGALLFVSLENRRQSLSAPAVTPGVATSLITPPPPLYIPPQPPQRWAMQSSQSEFVRPSFTQAEEATVRPRRTSDQSAQPVFGDVAAQTETQLPAPPRETGATAIIDDRSRQPPSQGSDENALRGSQPSGFGAPVRARAGMLANRTMTLAQGTIIAAVLETAFDSTRGGFARALVQQDVRGFDGTRVLVPRGSRLIGEYAADTTPGQRRAMVAWARLIRPDGATIALASPATDPVGRNGIGAKVDTHFFERFAGAILQSSLDVGVNLASRAADSSVIVALPNSTQAIGSAVVPGTIREIRPTLRVAQGTSISVFVARDLDFTDVEPK